MSKGLSLYQLNARVLELVAEIDTAEASDDTETVIALEETLAELYPAIDAKRESYIHVIRSAEAQAAVLQDESRRLSHRAKAMKGLATHLKGVVLADMESNGEVTANAGIFRLRASQSPARVNLLVPAEMLPRAYQKVAVSANLNALKKALKDGHPVEGAELETDNKHLRIS